MIRRGHRFHGYNSLNYVYKNGKTFRGPVLAVRTAENTKRDSYRVAVVVSKKTSKSAVVRNRIRRRIYEIIRKHEAAINSPVDIVVTIFSDSVATVPIEKIENEILEQFKRAKILHQSTPSVHATIEQKEI